MRSVSHRASVALFLSVSTFSLFGSTAVFAESHTAGVPVLNSRPGAAYTVYLDFASFNYVGAWNGSDSTDSEGHPTGGNEPLFTPSFDDVSSTGTFSADQQTAIKTVFARMAQSYIGMNVNITTVDPAVAAGQAATDTARRNYYDATPNMMHMVFGSSERAQYITAANPSGNWLPGADGVSPGIGIASGRVDGPNALQGQHTSFMFTQGRADNNGPITNFNAEYVGGIGAHENAHSMGLNHQGDYTGNGLNHINEYSFGDDRTAPGQFGTYVPIIGDANSGQRIAWRVGIDDEQNPDTGIYQRVNDLQRMLQKSSTAYANAQGRSGGTDLHFINDNVAHTLTAAATPLVLTGTSIASSTNKGVIVPLSETDPNPTGPSSYTQDFYRFTTLVTSDVNLVAHDSTDLLTPGVADDDGTLRSTMAIFNSSFVQIGTALEDISTMFETYAAQLAAGTYYIGLSSFGGHDQINAANYDPATYFDTGAYFLSGSITAAVPEPTTICLILISGVGLLARRRRNIV